MYFILRSSGIQIYPTYCTHPSCIFLIYLLCYHECRNQNLKEIHMLLRKINCTGLDVPSTVHINAWQLIQKKMTCTLNQSVSKRMPFKSIPKINGLCSFLINGLSCFALSWISLISGHANAASYAESTDLKTAALSLIRTNQPGQSSFDPSASCPVFLVAESTTQRAIRINNNSLFVTALNIQATNLWSDVTQDASNCTSVPPQSACTIYLTAGNQTHPSTQINFSGTNTTTVSIFMNVIAPLAVGQAWRGGLIYSINPDGSSGQIAATRLAGNSSTNDWDPNAGPTIEGALDLNNGKANTQAIVNQLNGIEGQALNNFAAGLCVLYTASDNCGTYTGWYLPAANQLKQLMESNVDSNIFDGSDIRFWTSTQSIVATEAYSNYYIPPVTIESTLKNRSQVGSVCIRDFSYSTDFNAPS